MKKTKEKHGMTDSGEYICWLAMVSRCHNKNNSAFKRYGARKILVCRKWRFSFLEFLKDMGKKPEPNYSIDRIDNNLGYSKENCRWASPKQQANNRRNSIKVVFENKKVTLLELSELLDVNYATLRNRYRRKSKLFKQPTIRG